MVLILVFMGGIYLLSSETRYISVSVPYQDPVYETKTVTESVPYQEPVYSTFYNGSLTDVGFPDNSWTFSKATEWSKEYSGKDLLGNQAYTIKVCYGSQCTNYYQVNVWNIVPTTEITGYETKYRTEYKTVNEITRYVTRYRTENQYVTKTRLEWILK